GPSRQDRAPRRPRVPPRRPVCAPAAMTLSWHRGQLSIERASSCVSPPCSASPVAAPPGRTVLAPLERLDPDTLTGASGQDWFFASLATDLIKDLGRLEDVV